MSVNESPDDGGITQAAVRAALPPWINALRSLVGATVGGAGGFALTESPRAFVEFIVLDLLQGSLTGLAGEVGAVLADAGTTLGVSIVGPLDAALGPAADLIGGSVLGLILSIVEIGESIAASAGPLAPLIILATYATVLLVFGGLAVAIWRGYLLIRSAVV
jgi:hypothetical protein